MTNTLASICANKREHIAERKQAMPESAVWAQAAQALPPRGFKRALENKLKQKQAGLIAEIKKASPSGGLIRADFDPAALAKAYAEGGAACLSVITDQPYFQGRDEYLAAARNVVTLPVLRKDFMLDTYQVAESRVLGADCILLILAALNDGQARELEQAAMELHMDVLVEVHNQNEIDRALTHLSSRLIGINNRDLKTLQVNLATAETLAKNLPAPILAVCESGIRTHADIVRMQAAGLHCFLVGESLMREENVTAATQALLG